MIKEKEIKDKLKSKLHREPTRNEEINATTDTGIIIEILLEKVEELESRISILEKK